jgi:hypothetical protein
MATAHDLAREFLATKKTMKWSEAKKSAVFAFADWVAEKNKPKKRRLYPCGYCSEPDKPAVYFCHHQPNGAY